MNTFIKCVNHFKVICKHKWYVFQECCKMGIIWQGIVHDLSKFSPSEFIPSAKYFQGNMSAVAAEREAVGYSYAWRYHKGKNRHHWQWYVDMDGWDNEGRVVLNAAPMPDKYIKEMYCDMLGASRAYGGNSDSKQGAIDYYLKMGKEWVMHPQTKTKFEEMLGITNNYIAEAKYYFTSCETCERWGKSSICAICDGVNKYERKNK